MTADLTNLLPPKRRNFLSREYLFRLGTVAVWLLAILVLIHGLLLFPSYLYVNQQSKSRAERLAVLEAAGNTAAEQELKARVSNLETKAKQLSALGTQTSASGALRSVLAAPRGGIVLTGFTYAPGAKDANKMTLVGMAATRDSLQQYLETLDALPYIAKAELPISAYAKERDIAFTITLTGALMP